MRTYLIRRILLLVPTVFLVTIIVFLTVRLMPGDVVDLIVADMGEQSMGVDRASIEAALGLDVPIHVQYGRWVGEIFLHGNLGTSLRTRTTVTEEIVSRIPVTLELGLLSLIITNLIAFPVGIYSAIRQNTWLDYLGRSFAILSLATPAFWLASMLIVFGGRYWSWSPNVEYVAFMDNPIENLKMFLLPAFLTGTAASGGLMRGLRTITLEVIRQDYIRTAWSKGLRERVVILRHALRNSMIPLVTMLIPQLGTLIGGSVIMEQIFALPGMGRYLLSVIVKRDYLVVSGTNLIYAGFTMFLILLTDISYAWLDPRIRYR